MVRFRAAIACVCAVAGYGADVTAFPGAEGFGAKTPGGRGGKVMLVRNLNDSGPGSFRAACAGKGPRIIVFRVAGIIELKTPLKVTEPFLTVAAQTAPGDGLCLRGDEFVISTHDVILRYLRSRPGDIRPGEHDAIAVGGHSRNVIIDHCSATWSIDEDLSPSGNLSDITVQWCLIAEGLNNSIHQKGRHGYGSLARASGGVTFHHNLWAHNDARNPRLGDNYLKPPFPVFDFRNNVIYDYGAVCSGMTGDHLSANYVDNYIRYGPSSRREHGQIVLTKTAAVEYFIRGNVVEGDAARTADNRKMFDRPEGVTIVPEPFDVPKLKTTPPQAAYEAVLAGAGATLPVRDVVDARIVSEVRTRTGSIIDSQWEVGGWPAYRAGRPPRDTDGDGMPDAWETAHGLNPRNPADAAHSAPSGYSWIEEWINSIGKPAALQRNLQK